MQFYRENARISVKSKAIKLMIRNAVKNPSIFSDFGRSALLCNFAETYMP